MDLFLQKFVFLFQRLDFLFISLSVVLRVNVLLVHVVNLALVPLFSRVWFLGFYFIGGWVLCVVLLVSFFGFPWPFMRLLLDIFHFDHETRMKGLGQLHDWLNAILFNQHFYFKFRTTCGCVIRVHLSNTVETRVFVLKNRFIVLLHLIFCGWFYLSPSEFFYNSQLLYTISFHSLFPFYPINSATLIVLSVNGLISLDD